MRRSQPALRNVEWLFRVFETGRPVALRQGSDPESARAWSLTPQPSSRHGVVILARGEFDIAAVPDVHRVIRRVAAEHAGAATVTIDLSGVSFLDAAMLGALVSERQAMQESGGDLVVTNVSAWVRRIIDICGLGEMLGL